jgi:Uma2 family endonuclease
MSMPLAHPRRWTRAEVDRLIDEREGNTPRYELVGGELLVTPGPSWRHQRVVLSLALLLQPYLARQGLGEVLLGPAEMPLNADEYYEPDIFVVPFLGGRPREKTEAHGALLVCETLSPGSSRHDRITKRRAFQRLRIAEYWVIDVDARAFEIWRPEDERPALIDDRVVWLPPGANVPFELDVAGFFASVEKGQN